MRWRTVLDLSLPAFPLLFMIFGVGLYWHDNILPTLAPSVAFWAVAVIFYLDARVEIVGSRAFPLLIAATSVLWLLSSITGQNLKKYIVLADQLKDYSVILKRIDLYYSYGSALLAVGLALTVFIKYEPLASQRISSAPKARQVAS
jgi:hypothetical protein